MTDDELKLQYDTLKTGCGMIELRDWTLLELSGADRKSFLHNFCTADIKALDDGKTTEAFVLNGKGKIIGFVHVAALTDRLLLAGAGSQAKALVEHLDKYIIREDVTIKDLCNVTEFIFVGGEKAAAVLNDAFQIKVAFGDSDDCKLGTEASFTIVHGEIAGPGYLLLVNKADYADVSAEILGRCNECLPEVLEAIRLEHGTPWFGAEVDDSCLPQEIDRDEKAINFNKGCYLGQETVARIDALGRVNRLLRFAVLKEGTAAVGDELTANEKTVGTVLSAAKIPGTSKTILSAILKRSASNQGSSLQIENQTATIL